MDSDAQSCKTDELYISNLLTARNRNARGSEAGFTLIEMMVVMAIIVILMTIAVARVTIWSSPNRTRPCCAPICRFCAKRFRITRWIKNAALSLDDLVNEKYLAQDSHRSDDSAGKTG